MKYYKGSGDCGKSFLFKTTADFSRGWVKWNTDWVSLDEEELNHLVNLINRGRVDEIEGEEA